MGQMFHKMAFPRIKSEKTFRIGLCVWKEPYILQCIWLAAKPLELASIVHKSWVNPAALIAVILQDATDSKGVVMQIP